jgi:hypothetical protein
MPTPHLLSGDNPQIPLGYGEAPVMAFLDAVPDTGPGGWKHAACRRIDAIVSQEVPGVSKAVKWNSPFYGVEQGCWFLSFHCFDAYVMVTFFQGAQLNPPPKEKSKTPAVRYHHVRDPALGGDDLGARFADWVRQAAALPGERL